jgi:hypothetical protein
VIADVLEILCHQRPIAYMMPGLVLTQAMSDIDAVQLWPKISRGGSRAARGRGRGSGRTRGRRGSSRGRGRRGRGASGSDAVGDPIMDVDDCPAMGDSGDDGDGVVAAEPEADEGLGEELGSDIIEDEPEEISEIDAILVRLPFYT